MLVGVPMNIGLGSFSFSSSFPAGAWAPSAARVKNTNAELAKNDLIMEILERNAPGVRSRGGCLARRIQQLSSHGRWPGDELP